MSWRGWREGGKEGGKEWRKGGGRIVEKYRVSGTGVKYFHVRFSLAYVKLFSEIHWFVSPHS